MWRGLSLKPVQQRLPMRKHVKGNHWRMGEEGRAPAPGMELGLGVLCVGAHLPSRISMLPRSKNAAGSGELWSTEN